jgi:hypothetical protein
MSNTAVIYPIVRALVKAEEIIGPDRTWHTVNKTQTLFLKNFFTPCRQESLSIREIESIASFTAEEINRFLRERGFTIELAPLRQTGRWREFGVASVLDLLVEWLKPGTGTTLKAQNQQVYPAVHLGTEVSSFYQAADHPYPIAQLKTTSNDLVYMTRLDRSSTDFELLNYVQRLTNSLKPIYEYGGVLFPMVDLKQEEDISWLLDLETTNSEGEPVKITQALQETHLAMNPEGARAKSAVAVAVAVAAAYRPPRPDLLIDGPFLIWFQRPGLSEPLFAGYITEGDWKDPGKLA